MTLRASQSFTEDEVGVLEALIKSATTGVQIPMAMKTSDAFTRVAIKIARMKAKIAGLKDAEG